jgi:ribosomal protein S18 acetylase RimI-like enzyme
MSVEGIRIEAVTGRGRDLDEGAMVAARAFYDDPFFEFLDPRGVTRARGLALFWRASIAALGPTAKLLGARRDDGHLVGLCAVIPPGGYPLPIPNQARALAGALRGMILRPPALRDGLKYLLAIDRAHPKEPVSYLFLLVVDPSVQRRGIGCLLQRDYLDAAEREGLDCYLETQKEANLAYYRRFGYEVERVLRPVPGGPPLWTMRRPVGAAAS